MRSGFGKRQLRSMVNFAAGKTPTDTASGVWFVGLNTADPADDGQAAGEVTGPGYARVATTAADWAPATDANPSLLLNVNPILFPTATGDWAPAGTPVTHASLWTTLAGTAEAEYIGRAEALPALVVVTNDRPNFAAGALRMSAAEVISA